VKENISDRAVHLFLNFPLPLFVMLLSVSGLAGCSESKETVGSDEVARNTEVAPRKKFDFRPAVPKKQEALTSQHLEFPDFVDVATTVGIDFNFDNGVTPRALMIESTGGGCGWTDYDRDGRLDLYLTQGGPLCPQPQDVLKEDALFRQLPNERFLSVAVLAGIRDTDFGHGVAAGDYDNDGFDDLFVANAGQSHLYLNQGDGTFLDGTDRMVGLRNVWSTTPAWGDVDRDGNLDLYVCNYNIYDPCHPVRCLDKDGIPSICHPRNVEAEPDSFFISSGDGQLQECSQTVGLFGPGNKGLGVVIADLTGDSWPDVYVANDTTANFFFVNDGTGRKFKESSLILGGAFNATGETQASMGIAFGDYDNNGLPDLLLTHFTGESNTLYRNMGPQGLQDVSSLVQLREASLPKLGFGAVMYDFNSDTHLDLFVTNGHIDPRYANSEGYEMEPQLFSFDGVVWKERTSSAGDFLSRRAVGRGVASGDFDADGDMDLCVVHHNSPASLLQNESRSGRNLRVELIGRSSNRNGYNTKVSIRFGEEQRTAELAGGTSYAASHEHVLTFGLGNYSGAVSINVQWTSGTSDRLEVGPNDRVVTVLEGRGSAGNPHDSGNDE
jgi:hypothetical protein